MARPNNLIAGLVTGAVVGTLAGILFAPKIGKETRGIVATRAGVIRQKAGGYVGNLREKMRKGRIFEGAQDGSNNHVGVNSD